MELSRLYSLRLLDCRVLRAILNITGAPWTNERPDVLYIFLSLNLFIYIIIYLYTYIFVFILFIFLFDFSRTQARILVWNNLEFILLRDERVLQVDVSVYVCVCHNAFFTCVYRVYRVFIIIYIFSCFIFALLLYNIIFLYLHTLSLSFLINFLFNNNSCH